MNHTFDADIAADYGILEAIILNHIYFWILKNKANNVNFYDGYYWTYNSTRAFTELFPYASQKKIQTALKHLIDNGLIITGNYNKSAYDRTLWYALTDKGNSIMTKSKMEEPKKENQLGQYVKPIPDINTDINTDNKPYISRFIPPTLEQVSQYCIERSNNVDPEHFINYYSSNGWMVGKNKMKDWKAAVRTWERNGYSNSRKEKEELAF